MPQKTEAIIEMANELKEKGLIDGIGMQSHLDARSGSDAFPSVSAYEKALKAFTETGLDVQITELDVTVNDNTLFDEQAKYYSDIMDAIVKYADNISAVVVWGTTDDQSWRSSKYPLLFNEDYTAKPSYYQIVDGIDYDSPQLRPQRPQLRLPLQQQMQPPQLPAETFCTVTQTATKRLTFQMLL